MMVKPLPGKGFEDVTLFDTVDIGFVERSVFGISWLIHDHRFWCEAICEGNQGCCILDAGSIGEIRIEFGFQIFTPPKLDIS